MRDAKKTAGPEMTFKGECTCHACRRSRADKDRSKAMSTDQTQPEQPYISRSRAILMLREPERIARFAERTGRTFDKAWLIAKEFSGKESADRHVSKQFVNEIGNQVVVNVSTGDPGCLCRLSMEGPTSMVETYATRMELEQLRDALTEVLQNDRA